MSKYEMIRLRKSIDSIWRTNAIFTSMADEGESQFNVESVVDDVLQQNGKTPSDNDLASRKAQETALRIYEAASWLRKMVGVVLAKDLPAEPSEEDFRLGLRSGIILCNALNKVRRGAVPKIVAASDTVIIPDGFAHTAHQYSDNIRNFLVAIEKMGIPTFQASDLEKGGESFRIANCVLALKSYHERGYGQWGNGKLDRKNSADLLLGIASRCASALSSEENGPEQNLHGVGASPEVKKLVREMLADKNQEEIPMIVENMISKLMEDFEQRLPVLDQPAITASYDNEVSSLKETGQTEQTITAPHDNEVSSLKEIRPMEQTITTSHDNEVSSSKEIRPMEIITTSHDNEVSSPKETGQMETITASHDNEVSGWKETGQTEIRTTSPGNDIPSSDETEETKIETASEEMDVSSLLMTEDTEIFDCTELRERALRCQELAEHQQRSIQELKNTLHSTQEEIRTMQLAYKEQVEDLGKHMNTLGHAASGYTKAVEENRKLYNQVQDLKGNIRVYLRVRPFLPGQCRSCAVDDIEERSITLIVPSRHGKGKKSFTFNRCFGPTSSQEEVFTDTQPLIRSVLDGYNVCIFAYGQTGSGKTYTMTGPKELTKESLGVNYRALNDLFLISEDRKGTISYEISVQMIEIYNEQVRDLLVTDGANKKLEIRNNAADGINVPNANRVRVSSPSDVINLMNLGHKNRAVGFTNMNDRSSRSHSCLTVHVVGTDLTSGSIIRGCMHLVDLAGSERADKTDAAGDRMKEAQFINKSLSALGDVISSLAQKQSHVPYRNSKLTQLLQDSLGGQAKTLMFVHISPEADALGETLSTLKFAERVSTVELGVAKSSKDGGDLKELKEQITALKAALAQKEGDELGSLQRSPDSVSTASWIEIGDACKTQGGSESASTRHSLDSQDLPNSPSWPMQPGNRHSLENDMDEVDTATSDSSEADHQQQIHMNRSSSLPHVTESKIKKPTPKPTTTIKSQERSPAPQPVKRSPATIKSGRQVAPAPTPAPAPTSSAAARRKPVKGK